MFIKEATHLLASGMPRADVCKALEESTDASGEQGNIRPPILGNYEDEDPMNHEVIFEEKYTAEAPEGVVGLMFVSY